MRAKEWRSPEDEQLCTHFEETHRLFPRLCKRRSVGTKKKKKHGLRKLNRCGNVQHAQALKSMRLRRVEGKKHRALNVLYICTSWHSGIEKYPSTSDITFFKVLDEWKCHENVEKENYLIRKMKIFFLQWFAHQIIVPDPRLTQPALSQIENSIETEM